MSFMYDGAASLIRRVYDNRLHDPPILDLASRFPEARSFIAAWPVLRDEALRLADDIERIPRFHELMAAQADISNSDGRDWRMFVLKAYGVELPANMARCPELARLVQSVPEVLSATLSFLAPGKRIPQHRGPFRGVLRFYLGLSVPLDADGDPSAILTIDGTEYHIADGECLLWDDTYPHKVENRSERQRIALLLDIRRQGMPLDMELLSRLLIVVAGAAVRLRKLA